MIAEQTGALSPGESLPRRVAVTLGAIAAVILLERIPLPLLDPEALARAGLLSPLTQFSVLALGLGPLVTASVLVELVALAVPRLATRRHGTADERAPLTRAAWLLAAVLAISQGYGIASYLQQTAFGVSDPVLPWGAGPAVVVTLTLAAGTFVAGLATVAISRHGIGSGVPVLLSAATVEAVGRGLSSAGAEDVDLAPLPVLVLVAVAVIAPLALRHRRAAEGPRVPFPTSGLALVQIAPTVLLVPAALEPWFEGIRPFAEALRWAYVPAQLFQVVFSAALAFALSRLFCPAGEVVGAFERAVPGRWGESDVRSAVARAHRRALQFVVAVTALPLVVHELGFPFMVGVFGLLAVATVVATALDLAEELRARSALGALVPARAIHRLFAVPPALEALAAAGIPAVARGRRYRALFWFFAPYAPVEILVPPERVAEAEGICARAATRAPTSRGPGRAARAPTGAAA